MEIQDVVESLDSVQETLREFYVKADEGDHKGKFVFNPSAATQGLKRNRDEILREKQNIEGKFRGIDIDEYNQLKEKERLAKEKKIKDDGDWAAREKSINEAHSEELKKRDGVVSKLSSALETNLIKNAAQTALISAKAKNNGVVLLPHVISKLKMMEASDGSFVARVIDESGQVRFKNGHEMTIEELVSEFKENKDFQDNFIADVANGSGATNGKDRKPGGGGEDKLPGNPVERLKRAHIGTGR